MMKFSRPRGTQDIFGDKMAVWSRVEKLLSDSAGRYGYSEIRTPIFETSDLFVRAVGEGTDIVTKEMYTFQDKKGRDLTLRPENTAPVMRAFLENGLHRSGGLTRFFYIGPMFRYDRPQTGRYRQFHQFGAEAIGSSNPAVDAEIIDLSLNIYRTLDFPRLELKLNSVGCPRCRPAFKDILRGELSGLEGELCRNCGERAQVNPLRIFDCKECTGVKEKLPRITDHLCGECRDHFEELQDILGAMGVTFVVDPLLVRGLDYYTKTAFEIIHPDLGGQNSLCGGGRYDGLAEDCGGGPIPAVGFSTGIERLIENIPEKTVSSLADQDAGVFILVLTQRGYAKAMSIAGGLRREGIRAVVELSGRAMKKQLKTALDSGASYAVFIGEDEIEKNKAAVKDLGAGEQVYVPFTELVGYLKDRKEIKD